MRRIVPIASPRLPARTSILTPHEHLRGVPRMGSGGLFSSLGQEVEIRKPRTTTIVVVAVIVLLLVPLPFRGRGWKAVFDLGHLVVGAALAFLAARFLRKLGMGATWLRDGLALVVAALAGTALEAAQGYIGREPSWLDAATNALGSAAWFLGHRAYLATTPGRRRVAWMGTALLLLVGLAYPALTAVDTVRQAWDWPKIASFEDRLELTRVGSRESTYRHVPEHATEGASSLRVDLHAGTYPGVSLHSFPEDWSAYEALAFDLVILGDEPLRLIFELEDQFHDRETYDYYDRFRRIYELAPGSHSFRIPLEEVAAGPKTRRLDLNRMNAIIWFVDGLASPRTFHLDHVRLVDK